MKRPVLHIFSAIASVFFTIGAMAASPYFLRLNSDSHGLTNNAVRCILEDSRGYVWIGSQMGLNRYDGTRIKVFPNNVLPSSYIFSLGEDKEGNIWIATGEGVAVYDYMKDRFFEPCFEDGSRINWPVTSITCDSSGKVWLDGRSEGLISWSYRTGYLKKHDLNISNSSIIRMAFSRDGNLVLCRHLDYIYLYSEQTGKAVPLDLVKGEELLRGDEIYGPVFDSRSNAIFYVATKRTGIIEVNIKAKTARVLYRFPGDCKPNGMSSQGGRFLLCATSAGILRYDLTTGRHERYVNVKDDPHSLSDNYVLCAVSGRNGGIWAGTSTGGVCHTDPELDCFTRVTADRDGVSIEACKTLGMSEDSDGNIWIATERMGLFKYDTHEGNLYRIQNARIPLLLTSILADRDRIWIGTMSGLLCFTPSGGKVRAYRDFREQSDNRIVSLYKSSDSRIYAATSNSLCVYDEVQDRFAVVDNVESNAYEAIVEDTQGRLWLGSYSRGLFSVDPHEGFASRSYPLCPQRSISCLIPDGDGNIYVVGYDAVVSRFNQATSSFDVFTPESTGSLPSSAYVSACMTEDGHLWIGTTGGLANFNPADGSCVSFDSNSGMVDNSFSKAALRTSSGKVAFGSLDGFIIFDPAVAGRSSSPERVDIVSMKIGTEELSPRSGVYPLESNINETGSITLPSSGNYFSFEFAAPGASYSANLTCRLEGYDKEPHNISQSKSISYFGLSPGKYVLKLSGHRDLAITIRPPFWQSRSGVLIILLLILLSMALLAAAVYVWQKHEQNARMARFEKEQESAIVRNKMEFLSNVVHEIKTPLTLIKTPLHNLSAQKDISEENYRDLRIIRNSTDYLDKLSKELLTFISVSEFKYVLDPRRTDIIDFISGLCFNYSESAKSAGIRLNFLHDEEELPVKADLNALSKILNNLFGNALKYAESYIEIEAHGGDNAVTIAIRNDGKPIPESKREEIFKPFVSLDTASSLPARSFGIGLPLARRLAELHGGSLVLSPGGTTEFVLSLPAASPEAGAAVAAEEEPDDGSASVLLVEDSRELLSFLKDRLSPGFSVIVAENAGEAFPILSKSRVDCILTDLNMPGMNGVDFCRKVKMNPATEHIPIIVISATTSEQAKIQCMEAGASMYIEKPFTVEYLAASLRSVLARPGAVSGETGAQDKDATFLANLDSVVNRHLSDDSFSVKQLEEELFVSHSTLNRKMRELLQMSPVDYIRSKRLNAALELLKQKKLTISEVAYSTGFGSLSYFSRSFKEYFGKAPTDYVK
ncbi:MAG: response regulator [Bacteroidales bacterium]|nr:response regulator [Bacteroidales bacterium]